MPPLLSFAAPECWPNSYAYLPKTKFTNNSQEPNNVGPRHSAFRCHSEPFAVILSEAKNLALPAQDKLREESRSGSFPLHAPARSPSARIFPGPRQNSSLRSLENHSPPVIPAERRKPISCWTDVDPRFAGETQAIFIPLGGAQAHEHSE